MEFKERLKQLRTERGLTQAELGNVLNYNYTAISNYESGRNTPSIENLKKIAEYFNISLDYLVCLNNIKSPYIEQSDNFCYEQFKNYFGYLNHESRNELLFFMEWLIKKQNLTIEKPKLKVAENKTTYKTKRD